MAKPTIAVRIAGDPVSAYTFRWSLEIRELLGGRIEGVSSRLGRRPYLTLAVLFDRITQHAHAGGGRVEDGVFSCLPIKPLEHVHVARRRAVPQLNPDDSVLVRFESVSHAGHSPRTRYFEIGGFSGSRIKLSIAAITIHLTIGKPDVSRRINTHVVNAPRSVARRDAL